MSPEQVATLLQQALPEARIQVRSEDHTHFEARVVSERFSGLRPLARHQQVYAALGELVGREIHALQIDALTPAEVTARGVTNG